jgi:hypothetical protein
MKALARRGRRFRIPTEREGDSVRRLFETELLLALLTVASAACGSRPAGTQGCQSNSQCPLASTCSGGICVACGPSSDGIDAPDDQYADTNCDGVDGDVAQAVFVAPPDGGGDDTHSGTLSEPVATITKALEIAGALPKDVYVLEGTYAESATLAVPSQVSIYGGYVAAGPWGPFTGARTGKSAIMGSATAISISGENNNLDHLSVESAAGANPGESSIGILAAGSKSLLLNALTVYADNGAPGADGATGANGASGGGQGAVVRMARLAQPQLMEVRVDRAVPPVERAEGAIT